MDQAPSATRFVSPQKCPSCDRHTIPFVTYQATCSMYPCLQKHAQQLADVWLQEEEEWQEVIAQQDNWQQQQQQHAAAQDATAEQEADVTPQAAAVAHVDIANAAVPVVDTDAPESRAAAIPPGVADTVEDTVEDTGPLPQHGGARPRDRVGMQCTMIQSQRS